MSSTGPTIAAAIAPPPRREAMQPYLAAMLVAARRTLLPFWLIAAVIQQESGYDPRAQSAAGAVGLMQIMPQTARDCGVSAADLWEPDKNIHLGARILADRYDCFRQESGDERLKFALAAYNGGLAPVLNAQALAFRRGLNPSQWASLAQVLPDTQVYLHGEWLRPDYEQILGYVSAIWRHFGAWRNLPEPSDAETANDHAAS